MSLEEPWYSKHLDTFCKAHKNGEPPSLWDYWDEHGDQCDEQYLRCLLQEDFIARHEKSKGDVQDCPWFCDYLAKGRLWDYRKLACEAWTGILYGSGDTALAESLSLLNFGPYKADRVAGIGGFGTVLHASHETTKTSVAIKLPHRNETAINSLDREIGIIPELPNRTHGFPTNMDVFEHTVVEKYMQTAWIEGESISEWLTTDPSEHHRLEVCRQIANLVKELGSSDSIYHGDISPDNILIERTSSGLTVHLVDFASAACGFYKRNNWPIFTRTYAAPELWIGVKLSQPSCQSDLWSLAAVIYEILMGKHPFGPLDDIDDSEYKDRIKTDTLPSPLGTKWGPLVEPIGRCLKCNPHDRAGTDAEHILRSLPSSQDVFDRSVSHPLITIKSDISSALCLDYLDGIIGRYGTVTIPLLKEGDHETCFSIEPLMVELPLILHSDPEKYHYEQRSGSTHAERVGKRESSASEDTKEKTKPTTLSERCIVDESTAFVGQPGSGKSTILRWIAYSWAQQCRAQITGDTYEKARANPSAPMLPDAPLLPVMLVCRDLGKISQDCTLPDLIDLQLEAWAYSGPQRIDLRDEFLQRLKSNQAILIVDGLDELPTQEIRKHVAVLLDDLAANATCRIMLSSRSVGYKHIQVYLSRFAHVVIGKISPGTREAYVRGFGSQVPDLAIENLVRRVRADDRLGQLCESMLMLVLIAQIGAVDRLLPDREHEVYQRAIELMLQNQYAGDRPRVNEDELFPHLEHLANYMHINQRKNLWDIHVVEQFEEARSLVSVKLDQRSMSLRETDELLEDIVRKVQILNIAGSDDDPVHRRVRKRIQFMHQRLQEYMAGGIALSLTEESGNVNLSGLRNLVGEWKDGVRPLVCRPIELSTTNQYTEHTVSSEDYDTVPLWVAKLVSDNPSLADEVFRILLPDQNSPPELSRALSVLALRCLGDDPNVSTSIAKSVIDCALKTAILADCRSNNLHTLLDDAVAMVSMGKFGGLLRDTAFALYLNSIENMSTLYARICMKILAQHIEQDVLDKGLASYIKSIVYNLESKIDAKQLLGAFTACETYYLMSWDKFKPSTNDAEYCDQYQRLLDTLLAVGQHDKGRIGSMVLWALCWATNSMYTDKNINTRPSETLRKAARDIALDYARDPLAIRYACQLQGLQNGVKAAPEQEDWIYKWAIMADGIGPQAKLGTPVQVCGDDDAKALQHVLENNKNQDVQKSAALALTRNGVKNTTMYSALMCLYEDSNQESAVRDEALIGLVSLNDPRVWTALLERTHSRDDTEPYKLYERSFLGLLSCDNPDLILQAILYYDDNSDVDNYTQCYAHVLAGMKSQRGREYLAELQKHNNDAISKAAKIAIEKAKTWGMWPDDLELTDGP